MISTVMSVASFSVVLAESFAAVGLSTLVPATFLAMARTVKGLADAQVIHDATMAANADVAVAAMPVTTEAERAAKLAAWQKAFEAKVAELRMPSLADVASITGALDGMSKTADASAGASVVAAAPRPQDAAAALIKVLGKSVDHVDLLVPKSATIDAKFEFYGAEKYAANAEVGGQIEVVTVKAGYSALYETHSSNEIKLHVEFGLVSPPL